MLEYKYMNSDSNGNKNSKGLGERVKTAREKLGMTQADVAKKSKMTVNYYAMIERGEVNPSFNKLQSLAKTLGIKLEIS
jgi:transcriptional regulator with XRE-family HTH domain